MRGRVELLVFKSICFWLGVLYTLRQPAKTINLSGKRILDRSRKFIPVLSVIMRYVISPPSQKVVYLRSLGWRKLMGHGSGGF